MGQEARSLCNRGKGEPVPLWLLAAVPSPILPSESTPPALLSSASLAPSDLTRPPCSGKIFSHFSSNTGSNINSRDGGYPDAGSHRLYPASSFPQRGWRVSGELEPGIHVSEGWRGQMGVSGAEMGWPMFILLAL